MKKLYLLIALIAAAPNVHADPNKTYHNAFNTCYPTKAAINNYEPKVFETSNNLMRKPGGNPVVCGEKLILRGRVLDKNCVPVADAKVYLWQVGCDGKYPYEPLRNVADSKYINIHSGSSFTGNGAATTDNNGEFQFITIYPAKSEHHKRNINIRIEHRELEALQTQIDPIAGNETYDFTIVMGEKNKFRKY